MPSYIDRGRLIAREKYPVLGMCERCFVKKACDRHHRDGDAHNNDRSNVAFLCRACHMIEDGRLKNLKVGRDPEPPKECTICRTLSKRRWKGRCHACNEYFRRHGVERTQHLNRGPRTHCGKGHLFTDVNTWLDSDGHKHCRQCHADYQREWRAA